jgi:hypothetical protein
VIGYGSFKARCKKGSKKTEEQKEVIASLAAALLSILIKRKGYSWQNR